MNSNPSSGAPRKLLVLGATGPTGRHVVDQALAAGHTVTAFVRDPAKLPVQHERLRIVKGDLTTDGPALAGAMRGQDAVISAIGVGQSLSPRRLFELSTPRVIAAMGQAGVKRLVQISAFGVGDTFAQIPTLPKIFVRTLLAGIYADKERGEEILTKSPLDWTIVYPAGLTNGPRTGNYRFGEHLEMHGFPTIPRADVADLMLRAVADPEMVRRRLLVAS